MLSLAVQGLNLFFTGNAGTGKSTLLHAIVAEMKRAHGASRVYVTASTGAAASCSNRFVITRRRAA